MTNLRVYLLVPLRERYKNAQSPVEKLVIVGETCSMLGDEIHPALQENSQGFPCELLRAVARCLAHA